MAKSRTRAKADKAESVGRRNILINGNDAVNQRGFDGDWAGASAYEYGYDRWFKNGSSKTQVVEDKNYVPSTVYTLSGDNLTTQQITSPASGGWYITIAFNAANVQLELGPVATDFEHRSYGEELALCQRYYQVLVSGDNNYWANGTYYNTGLFALTFSLYTTMRTTPTAGYTTGTNWYLIYTNGGTDLVHAISFVRLHPNGGGADITNGASGVKGYGGTIKTNNPACKIYFDAEL